MCASGCAEIKKSLTISSCFESVFQLIYDFIQRARQKPLEKQRNSERWDFLAACSDLKDCIFGEWCCQASIMNILYKLLQPDRALLFSHHLLVVFIKIKRTLSHDLPLSGVFQKWSVALWWCKAHRSCRMRLSERTLMDQYCRMRTCWHLSWIFAASLRGYAERY